MKLYCIVIDLTHKKHFFNLVRFNIPEKVTIDNSDQAIH